MSFFETSPSDESMIQWTLLLDRDGMINFRIKSRDRIKLNYTWGKNCRTILLVIKRNIFE